MQWVQKAVQYYGSINPATLTGAIDVIVVERPLDDGTGSTELACSPFHVRFGKLSVLRPIDKKVRIMVNDTKIPFYMKVGETGEAFFVFETDADVPEDLQTSPLAGPVSDDEGRGGEDGPGEPDDFDLDAAPAEGDLPRRFSVDSSPTTSRYASFAQTQLNSPTTTIRPLPSFPDNLHRLDSEDEEEEEGTESGSSVPPEADSASMTEEDTEDKTAQSKAAAFVPASLMLGTEKVAGLGRAALTGLASTVGANKKLSDVVKGEKGKRGHGQGREGEGEGEGGSGRVVELEKKARKDLEGLSINEEESRPGSRADGNGEVGEDVRKAARKGNEDVLEILGGPSGVGKISSTENGENRDPFSLQKLETGLHGEEEMERVRKGLSALEHKGVDDHSGPELTGDLMLDMSGYKMDDENTQKARETEQGLTGEGDNSSNLDAPLDAEAEEEIIAFTQSLLQSTDPATLRGFFDPSSSFATPFDSDLASQAGGESSRAASPTPPDSRGRSRASSPVRPMSISSLQELAAGDGDDAPTPGSSVFLHASPKQFSLKAGGKLHVFELSLCGSREFGGDRAADEQAFLDHQVTFSQFMEQDEITNHSDLVVKYGGRYLTWDNASPVLASLAVYRKSLVDHPEHHQRGGEGDGKSSKSTGWRSWWRGKPESTTSLPNQSTSPLASPEGSRPASPTSMGEPMESTTVEPLSPPSGPVDIDDGKHYAKTLRLTSDQLKTLGLKKGMNTISFSVRSSYSGYATCTSRIFLWESDFQVVISDIDGTITKSDALGHVFTMIGRDWTHLGVAKLYTDIARNGYKMMYLTSRAIGQADTTREYLKGIKQNGFQLPEGPVIMSPDRLMTSLHREVIMRKPEVFKMACLRDIQRLFHERSPFYAGFGNRITDALSYRSVDVPSSRIFTIDSNGEVKMELLELAGYKSSYIHMTDLVDQMFPPINRKTAPDFTDFNFWRAPMTQFDLPDLSPPSPALSARSDTASGRLGFPRLGSIASSLSRRSSRATLAENASGTNRSTKSPTPSSPLLQATVVEEPSSINGDFDEEDEFEHRSESSSMPGSLPNESDFERYRAAESKKRRSEAEAYKEEVLAGDEDEEETEEQEEEDYGPDDDVDELDFSSVPYL
ncbi:LNS2-domain-containing protein [Meredithblackwellia eburnea MCA 4105]